MQIHKQYEVLNLSLIHILLTQFMRGVRAEETAPILDMPISDTEKENRIRALHGEETYKLTTDVYKRQAMAARQSPP